jgi:hypothetical protein
VETGQLGIAEHECRGILFATMDGTLWQRLVAERGWTDERFAAWLADLWISQLSRSPAAVSDCDDLTTAFDYHPRTTYVV